MIPRRTDVRRRLRWTVEQARKFGRDWPDVRRLLDALRQYGIYYTDVHAQNIRVRA